MLELPGILVGYFFELPYGRRWEGYWYVILVVPKRTISRLDLGVCFVEHFRNSLIQTTKNVTWNLFPIGLSKCPVGYVLNGHTWAFLNDIGNSDFFHRLVS